MPKVSIIVPVYNTEKYLKECLDSLVNQTLSDIEIIIINDGSPDNSIEIIKNYSSIDSRIIFLDYDNQGLSGARNSGLEVVTGEYVMFVDSDDWIDVTACEKAYRLALDNNADLVLFSYTSESSSGSLPKYSMGRENIIFSETDVYNELFCGVIGLSREKLDKPEKLDSIVSAWGKLYKTQIIQQKNIRNIDLKLIPSECQLFNMEFLLNVNKAAYLSENLYHYRRNNTTSLTKNYKSELFQKWLYWIEYTKKILDDNRCGLRAYEAYYSRICFSIIPLSGNLLKKKNMRDTYNGLKLILNHPKYIEAFDKLNYSYFPIHWFIYFKFSQKKITLGVYILSKIMRVIINVRKK